MIRPRDLATALLLLLLAPGAGAGTGGNHVRVVLDISRSMAVQLRDGSGPNDPGRLAVLATMLLYDLVDPNPLRDLHPDSFVVLPFKPDWPEWTDPSQPPPAGTGPPNRATAQDPEARAAFRQRLHALPYDGHWTYFNPGLRAALDSLRQEAPGPDEHRVIVLVTDGLPEARVKAREAQLLQGLRSELLSSQVELYVLAFGPTAARERAFFAALFPGGDEGQGHHDPLGELFVDPTGRDLVLNMARIFSRSFGYLVEPNVPGQRSRALDLDGGVTPPKVAVVALSRGGAPAPSQTITPPVNAPRGLLDARETGAAYSVQMIEGVRPGTRYRLETDRDGADVAILRKVEPELQLRPGFVEHESGRREMTQVRQVVAETPFVLLVLAKSPTGTEGNQADLDIAFRNHGPRKSGCDYAWTGNYSGANQGSRQRLGAGVTYEIRMRFPENRADPGQVYPGFIDVIAKYNGRKVGEFACDSAQPVEVYPKIAIRTLPPDRLLEPQTLTKDQRGCVTFRLAMDDPAKLAVLGTALYRLRASVEPSAPELKDGALFDAVFSLDGEVLGYEGAGTPWYAGRGMAQAALLGPHEFCVTLGDPRIPAPSGDLGLKVQLQLAHRPYDDFRVVEPFSARLRVVPVRPPTPQDFPWAAFWALFWSLLAALVASRLIAPRRPLPADLGYSLISEPPVGAPDPDGAPVTLRRLSAPNGWQRLLGHSPRRPLQDPGSDRIVAWVKPLEQALYGLMPTRGIGVRDAAGLALALDRGVAPLAVHQDYLLHGNAGRWRLRIGYIRASDRTPAAPTPRPSRHFFTRR